MAREYNPDGLNLLAVAILERAVMDWEILCGKVRDKNGRFNTKYALACGEQDVSSLAKMDKFFASGWCDLLCGDMSATILRNNMHKRRAEIMRAPRQNASPQGGRPKRMYEYCGAKRTIEELSEMSGIPKTVLYGRMATAGWPIEKAMSTPQKK